MTYVKTFQDNNYVFDLHESNNTSFQYKKVMYKYIKMLL